MRVLIALVYTAKSAALATGFGFFLGRTHDSPEWAAWGFGVTLFALLIIMDMLVLLDERTAR